VIKYPIAVFGLGYVGCVSVACLAKLGHQVIGVDINPFKVELINQGKPTIIEKDIISLINEQSQSNRVSATTDAIIAVTNADLSIVCVGTPSSTNGFPDMKSIWEVAEQIGNGLLKREGFHTIAIRSTVPPGTCRRIEEIIAKASCKIVDQDFAVVSNPEFLREGTSIYDYFHPPYTIIGTQNRQAMTILRNIYGVIDAPIIEVDREVAEIIKYVNNSYHALKVVFANEVGTICKASGNYSNRVMDIFCKDHSLNISSVYFKPGFAFGGSCLPKDLRVMNAMAHSFGIDVPVLSAISYSNKLQIEQALNMVIASGKKRVGVLGLAFKVGTDDLRESPVVEFMERLLGKGYELIAHDKNVMVSSLMGANKQFVESYFPHLARLLVQDIEEVRRKAEIIVVTQRTPEYQELIKEMLPTKIVIDLVRLFDHVPDSDNYHGISW
jgi:GDP-mannose 6-dehydrogenase